MIYILLEFDTVSLLFFKQECKIADVLGTISNVVDKCLSIKALDFVTSEEVVTQKTW